MRIVLTMNLPYSRSFGGANRSNRALARALSERGHEVVALGPALLSPPRITYAQHLADLVAEGYQVSTNAGVDRYVDAGVTVLAVHDAEALCSQLRVTVQQNRPDFLLVSAEDPTQNLLAASLDVMPGRVVYLAHTPQMFPFGPESLCPSRLRTERIAQAARVVAISQYVAQYVREWSGLDAFVNHPPHFGPGPFTRLANPNGHVLLMNASAVKGIAIFLALARAFPGAKFAALPGHATTPDDIVALNSLPNVSVWKNERDLDNIFCRTSVLLMPTLWREGFGMAAVDAMLRGLPVIASDWGGLREAKLGVDYLLPVQPVEKYLDTLDTNLLPVPVVPEQRIQPWADCLQRLLGDPVDYQRVSAASQRAASTFVSALSVEPLESLLKGMLSARPSTPTARESGQGSSSGVGIQPSAAESRDAASVLAKLTPKQLALLDKRLRGRRKGVDEGSKTSPFRRILRPSESPLSLAQERLWFVDQYDSEIPHYNMPMAVKADGDANLAAMQQAMIEVRRRHYTLRTTFLSVEGKARQVVGQDIKAEFPYIDLVGLHEGAREKLSTVLANLDVQRPFRISAGPLVRGMALHLATRSHTILFNMHHIITDAWSVGVLFTEFGNLYATSTGGGPSTLGDLRVQYVDYSVWQRVWLAGDALEAQVQYWKKRLNGAPALLNLPLDRPRSIIRTHYGARERFEIPKEVASRLDELGRQENATLFMVVLAAFFVLLKRYSGQDDFCIGTGIAGRTHTELEGLIGIFINSLVIRAAMGNELSFLEAIGRVKEATLGAYAHQDTPFERILAELSLSANKGYVPLAQVGLVWLNAPVAATQLPDIEFSPVGTETGAAKFDLCLTMRQTPDGIGGFFEYDKALFDALTISRMSRRFQHLLESIATDSRKSVSALAWETQAELFDRLGLSAEEYIAVNDLTPTQRDFYLISVIDPENRVPWGGCSIEIPTDLDVDRWRQAIDTVTASSDALRSIIHTADGIPYWCVLRKAQPEFIFRDLRDRCLSSEETEQAIRDEATQSWRVDKTLLYRTALLRLSDELYVAVLHGHHATQDAASAIVFFTRVHAVYSALQRRAPVSLQRSDVLKAHIEFCCSVFDTAAVKKTWAERLAGVAPLSPWGVLRDATCWCESRGVVSRETLDSLRQFCTSRNISPPALFRCMFGLLLSRLGQATGDCVAYEAIHGRTKDTKDLIGCFNHVVPIIYPKTLFGSGNALLADCLRFAAGYRRSLGESQFVSVQTQERLTRSEGARFYFNFYNFSKVVLGDKVADLRVHIPFAENEVHLNVDDRGDEIQIWLHYNRRYFGDSQFVWRLLAVVDQLVAGAKYAHELHIFSDAELAQLLEWNDPAEEFPVAQCVHDVFCGQMACSPDTIAVVSDDLELSYAELGRLAQERAAQLQGFGIGPDTLVGVSLDRSAETVVTVLAILSAGGAYLPLDPVYPLERQRHILADSNVQVLLTDRSESFEGLRAIPIFDVWRGKAGGVVPTSASTPHLAYVIYTSGSTGTPKGSPITHRNVVRLFDATDKSFKFDNQDVWTLFHSYAFDFSVWEIWGALLFGGRLVVVPHLTSRSPETFYGMLVDEQVTILNQTPSAFHQLARAEEDALAAGAVAQDLCLRKVIFGGEALDFTTLAPWYERHSDTAPRLVNMYGITETTVHVTYKPLRATDAASRSRNVGRVIPDLQGYTLGRDLEFSGVGASSEIHVGGAGLGRGYLNRPALTTTRFTADPTGNGLGGRLYHSGDLARQRLDGELDYLGRSDFQVKIRGFRIELGEIESVLMAHDGLREVVVVAREETSGETRLVAYVVAGGGVVPTVNDLRMHILSRLPDYMVPSAFVFLDRLPLTQSGKVDRRALPEPEGRPDLKGEYVAPRNETEEKLAMIWSAALGLDKVGIDDNFFDLGGHSLLATEVVSRIRKAFEVDLPLQDLFEKPTIAGIAGLVVSKRAAANVILREKLDMVKTLTPEQVRELLAKMGRR